MATENTFLIPEENLAYLDERLAKLNRKAKKLSVAEITTQVTGVKIVKKTIERTDGTKYTYDVRYYVVQVDGISPHLPGYTFLGTLQHTENGNIIRSFEGAEIDTSFRSVTAKCDHCKLARKRNDTYLVKKDSGEVVQVGHNCVADYLGGVSPEHIAMLAEIVKSLDELCNEGFEGGGFAKRVIYLEIYMSYVSELISQKGWVSSAAAKAYAEKSGGEGHLEQTAGLAISHMFPSKDMIKAGFTPVIVSDASKEEAKKTIEYAKSLVNKPGNSAYEYNLGTLCMSEIIQDRNTGLAASAVAAYQRDVLHQVNLRERKQTLAEISARTSYQGTVGERKEWTLTVNKVITIAPSEYRYSTGENRFLYSMQDDQGNVFVWFSSSGQAFLETMTEEEAARNIETKGYYSKTAVNLKDGDKVTLKGTVKRHEEYKGIKQTALSRCKVVSIEGQEEGAIRCEKTMKAVAKLIKMKGIEES